MLSSARHRFAARRAMFHRGFIPFYLLKSPNSTIPTQAFEFVHANMEFLLTINVVESGIDEGMVEEGGGEMCGVRCHFDG